MTEAQQRQAVRKFIADWAGHGDEKQDTSRFWMGLLRNVFGIEEPEKFMEFELPVKLAHTSFIDGYIPQTRVLIEQKSRGISFKKGLKQSDGQLLTPYQQARRYAGYLPFNQTPRWIVVCNFEAFEIHDMNFPNGEPEVIPLADLEKEVHRLQFLVDTGNTTIQKEMDVSLQAGELVGVLFPGHAEKPERPVCPSGVLPVCRRRWYFRRSKQVPRLSGAAPRRRPKGTHFSLPSPGPKAGRAGPLSGRRPSLLPLCQRRPVRR